MSYSNLYTNKLHLADIGLPITASFMENVANRNQLYCDLLKGKMNVNRGMFFENIIAQELVMTGHGLTYAKFEHEESTQLQEVDFVIADGNRVIPLESEPGYPSVHRSIDGFMDRYEDRMEKAYVIHSKDLRVDGDVIYLPIYMTMFL